MRKAFSPDGRHLPAIHRGTRSARRGAPAPVRIAMRVAAAFVLALAGSSAQARGDGDAWIMVVGPMCLAQYPEYADTEMAGIFLRGADIGQFVDRPFARCYRQHNWASRALCTEVMGLQKSQMRELQTVYEHHRDEIRGMKAAFGYFNTYIMQDPTSASWPPACPDSAP